MATISRAQRILDLVVSLTGRFGRGVTIQEVRAAWTEGGSSQAPASLTAEIGSLVQRDLLVRTGGRSGRTEYAAKGFKAKGDVEVQPDDVELVYRACAAAVERLDRPVTTREVQTELVELRTPLAKPYPNAVRRALLTLARTRTRGSQAGTARVRQVEGGTTGRATTLWAPSTVPEGDEIPRVPRSASEALRWAVEAAVRTFGRPIRRQELELWLLTTPTGHTLGRWLPTRRLATLLADVGKGDRRSEAALRLLEITTRWTAYGGAPVRYALAEPTPVQRAVVDLEDMLHTTRFAEEQESVGYLRARAAILQSSTLAEWADRRVAMSAALLDEVRGEASVAEVHIVARTALMIAETCARQTLVASTHRFVQTWARELAAAEAFVSTTFGRYSTLTVGEAARLAEPDYDRWSGAARRQLGLDTRAFTSLIAEARRVALPSPGRARFAGRRPAPLSACDRVDFFQRIYSAVELPKTRSLIADALLVLGPMCRDAGMVNGWRVQHLRESWEWQTATVALALLGERPTGMSPANSNAEELALLLSESVRPLGVADFGDTTRAALVLGRLRAGHPLGAVE